jgi:type 1 fimbria pilin
MNKKSLSILLSACCAFSAFSAFSASAADTIDLKVTGTITNASCTPSLSNGGAVSFGHLPISDLSSTEINQLGSKYITLTITCDAPMPVGWTTSDNRKDSQYTLDIKDALDNSGTSNTPSTQYGLGETASGVKIGSYAIALGDLNGVYADGVKKDVIYTQYGQSASTTDYWGPETASAGVTEPGLRTFALADAGSIIPIAYKPGVFPLKISAAIRDATTLDITDDTELDGSATISIVYL